MKTIQDRARAASSNDTSRAAFTVLRRVSGGVRRLFLRVILRRLKKRQSVPIATATPRSLSRSRSSASVMSLLAAKAGEDQFGVGLNPVRMAVTALEAEEPASRCSCALASGSHSTRSRRTVQQPPDTTTRLQWPRRHAGEGQRIRLGPCTPASSPAKSMNQNQPDSGIWRLL